MIRLVVTDCDGSLTDGGVWYDDAGRVSRRFSVRDGKGVQLLREAGIETVIVTESSCASITARAQHLGVELVDGCKVKLSAVTNLMRERSLCWDEVAAFGDDVGDMDVLLHAQVSGCPPTATAGVWNICDVHTNTGAPYGAFREFADYILASQNQIRRT